MYDSEGGVAKVLHGVLSDPLDPGMHSMELGSQTRGCR